MSKKSELPLNQEFELVKMMDSARTGSKEEILTLLESSFRYNFQLRNHFLQTVSQLNEEILRLNNVPPYGESTR